MNFRHHKGFTLVELMIAMALGLLVLGSVIAMFVSISTNNSIMVSSTRLNQELRAISAAVGKEIRRARFVDGSITQIGRADSAITTFEAVTFPQAGCINFSYQNAPMGDHRAIRRRVANGRGEIVLSAGNAVVGCNADGLVLSSPQVDITNFNFVADNALNPRLITITITGRLVANNSVSAKTFTQTIRIRSAAI